MARPFDQSRQSIAPRLELRSSGALRLTLLHIDCILYIISYSSYIILLFYYKKAELHLMLLFAQGVNLLHQRIPQNRRFGARRARRARRAARNTKREMRAEKRYAQRTFRLSVQSPECKSTDLAAPWSCMQRLSEPRGEAQ